MHKYFNIEQKASMLRGSQYNVTPSYHLYIIAFCLLLYHSYHGKWPRQYFS